MRGPKSLLVTLVAGWVASGGGLRPCLGDDVEIHVIDPDRPVASQPADLPDPKPVVKPLPFPRATGASWLNTGDYQLDSALHALKFTDEQAPKVKAILESTRKANEEADKDYSKVAVDYTEKSQRATKQAGRLNSSPPGWSPRGQTRVMLPSTSNSLHVTNT